MAAKPPPEFSFSPIADALADVAAGKMIVLVDDEDRENEGDLVMAADAVTPQAVNFMIKEARGLVCLCLTNEKADALDLPPMTERNTSAHGTAFTVSVEAARGVTTGISAADRATTIRTAVADNATREDLVRPGHIFPLRARDGGVLVRAGHTEGAVDFARLARRHPAGVICEIINDDGTMARLPELIAFAAKHSLKICTVAQLIQYRMHMDRLVERTAWVRLPTRHGMFMCGSYKSLVDGKDHLALCHNIMPLDMAAPGAAANDEPVLVRVHSECLTGDALGSIRCDCAAQLEMALKQIQAAPRGVLVYMRQEGRGIGLANKLRAYELQDKGHDTVDANLMLGMKADQRDYGTGAQILRDLGVRKMLLMTNNPRKFTALEGYGLEIVDRVPIQTVPGDENRRYLKTKRDKLGHLLDLPSGSDRVPAVKE